MDSERQIDQGTVHVPMFSRVQERHKNFSIFSGIIIIPGFSGSLYSSEINSSCLLGDTILWCSSGGRSKVSLSGWMDA